MPVIFNMTPSSKASKQIKENLEVPALLNGKSIFRYTLSLLTLCYTFCLVLLLATPAYEFRFIHNLLSMALFSYH